MFLVFSLGCDMTEDRAMIMQAVLEGKLPPDSVTMEELNEVEDTIFEIIAERQTPFETFEVMQ
jgi:biotin synthase-like enzyme